MRNELKKNSYTAAGQPLNKQRRGLAAKKREIAGKMGKWKK